MKYSFVFNCFGYWYEKNLSFDELIFFTMISLTLVSFLLYYYSKISSKDKGEMSLIDIPIYNEKDIFSQEIVGQSNFVLVEKGTSIWTKVTVFVLVILVLTSSMSSLLTNGVLEYIN